MIGRNDRNVRSSHGDSKDHVVREDDADADDYYDDDVIVACRSLGGRSPLKRIPRMMKFELSRTGLGLEVLGTFSCDPSSTPGEQDSNRCVSAKYYGKSA